MDELDVISLPPARPTIDQLRHARTARMQVERMHAKKLAQAVEAGNSLVNSTLSDTASCSDSSSAVGGGECSRNGGGGSCFMEVADDDYGERANERRTVSPPIIGRKRGGAANSSASLDSHTTQVGIHTASRKRAATPTVMKRRSELVDMGGYASGDDEDMSSCDPVFRYSTGPRMSIRSVPWA